MLTAVALFLLYLACVGFHQSSAQRAQARWLKASARGRLGVRIAAWASTGLALWLLAQPQGLERGVPIWLGLFMACGFVSLLTGALAPNRLIPSAAGALTLALTLAMVAGGAALAGAP